MSRHSAQPPRPAPSPGPILAYHDTVPFRYQKHSAGTDPLRDRPTLPANLEVLARQPEGQARPVPLLFVHGAWHGAWCWEHFQSYFAAQGYASYAMNLRGHGGSEGRERLRGTTAEEYVRDISAVVRGFDRPPVLIGHSMGGYLLQKYLEQHAAPAAVLLATMPARGAIRIFNRMLRQRPWRTLRMHLTMRPYVQIETPELARLNLFSPDLPDDHVERYHARLQCESYRIGWDMSLLNVPRPTRLRKTPMLFLGATRDMLIRPSEVASTASLYGETAEFFDMAHDMMLDVQWQSVARRIAGWLQAHGL